MTGERMHGLGFDRVAIIYFSELSTGGWWLVAFTYPFASDAIHPVKHR